MATGRKIEKAATTPFCQICRYVIVDKVDPSKHRKLDDAYDKRYPT
jgi:hypothetical protein